MVGGTRKKRKSPQWLFSEENIPFGTFAVIDPFSRMLFVPLFFMHDTLAMHRPGVPSLCRLFLRGRCRQGTSCFQAHADVDVISHLREAALREPTCCVFHGARGVIDCAPNDMEIVVVKDDTQEEVLRTTLAHTARTKGLRLLLEKKLFDNTLGNPNTLVVLSSFLCRLHTSCPCCRFGHDCNFIHLCREKVGEMNDVKKTEESVNENIQEAQESQQSFFSAFAINCSFSQTNSKTAVGQQEGGDGVSDANKLQISSPSINLLNKTNTAPIVSLIGTPKLGTSPAMSRSHNSTLLGVVWQHNPYFVGSSTSSFAET